MKAFFDWFHERGFGPDQPWLILGKGPSFARRGEFDLSSYKLLSINHAVREARVTVAHLIDLDVVEPCAEALERNAEVVVMPWIPHEKNRPGSRSLEELAREHPTLARLESQGRLLWYNLSSAGTAREGSPVVQVKFFSAEAVLNLLIAAGVRRVRSLGIDGGSSYSGDFAALAEQTLLANKWKSFDLQFSEMARSILVSGVDYAPLHVPSPVRVFVAATEKEMLPCRVLEFSIRKRASMTVSVFPLCQAQIPIPLPKDRRNLPRTPFSFHRFLIPQLCGYQGRAIYLDADMQVFRDIAELWLQPLDGDEILTVGETGDAHRRPQFSVMLLNCDLLRWDIREIVAALDRGELSYETLMYHMAVATRIRPALDPGWNALEHFEEGNTRLLHYTDMPTQPWIYSDNRLGHLWMRDLCEAVELGHIPLAFVEEEVRKGHVRPSLLPQVQARIDEGLLLPRSARALDVEFRAPYRSIAGRRLFSGQRSLGVLRAYVRSLYHRGPWSRWVGGLRRRLTQRN